MATAQRNGNGKGGNTKGARGGRGRATAKVTRAAASPARKRPAAKQVTRGAKPKPPKAARLVVVREEPMDEFSAAGGMPTSASSPGHDRSTLASATRELSWPELDREAQAMARTIGRRFKPEVIIGLAHGGVFVGEAVARALKLVSYPVRVVARSRDHAAQPGVAHDLPAAVKGKRVLIVDDVASSGDSLEFALRLARAKGAKAIATAALVARPGRYEPDFAALTSDTFFVFPWDYQSLVDEARFAPRG
jgi:hypoxanthine phosphoribosyltransferase